MTVDANDLGTDVACGSDVAPVWGLASGFTNLALAILRRLITPRGGLFYAPNYGTDIRAYLNRRLGRTSVAKIKSDIEAECVKDERVDSASVTVSFNALARTMTVAIQLETALGPFDLILAATSVTVALLSVNGVAVAAAAAGTAAQQVIILQGGSGPSGGTGPIGPAGGAQVTLPFPFGIPDSSSGSEDVDANLQVQVDFSVLPGTVTIEMTALGASSSGTATFRVRTGGSLNNADGTVRASTTTASASLTAISATSGSITNPGGQQLVKISLQSSALGQDASLAGVVVTIR